MDFSIVDTTISESPTTIKNGVSVIDYNITSNLTFTDFFGSQTLTFVNMPLTPVTFTLSPDSTLMYLFHFPQKGSNVSFKIDIGDSPSLTLVSENSSVTFVNQGISTLIMEVLNVNPPFIYLQDNTGSSPQYEGVTGPTGPAGYVQMYNNAYYGYFYDTAVQTATPGTDTPVMVHITSSSIGFSIGGNGSGDPTQIVAENKGMYNLQFSAQMYIDPGDTISIWIQKNGVVVANSARTANTNYTILSWNWFVELDTNEYVEIYWKTTTGNSYLDYSINNPSAIVSIHEVINTRLCATGPSGDLGKTGPIGSLFYQNGQNKGDYITWQGAWVSQATGISLGSNAGTGYLNIGSNSYNSIGKDSVSENLAIGIARSSTGSGLCISSDCLDGSVSVSQDVGQNSVAMNTLFCQSTGVNIGQCSITQGVSIGNNAGNTFSTSVSLGYNSGITGQNASITIGNNAYAGTGSVYIGNCVSNLENAFSSFIGTDNKQNYNCISIGNMIDAINDGIVLNVSETTLSPVVSGFYVSPIRGQTNGDILYYDTTSKEFLINNEIYGNITSDSLSLQATGLVFMNDIIQMTGTTQSFTGYTGTGNVVPIQTITFADISIPSNSFQDFYITFSSPFATAPFISFISEIACVRTVTNSGCVVRVYNMNGSSLTSITLRFLTILKI